MHTNLTEVFASHTYVGLVDSRRRIVAIQSGVKLFLVDYGKVCNEYFYQVGLTDFANFGNIAFEPPLDVEALVRSAVEVEKRNSGEVASEDLPWDTIPAEVTKQLVERREMLREYFSLEVSEDGQLLGIPLLVKGYTPSLAKLPRFLMRLGPCVDWGDEKRCFESFLVELASFYTVEQLPNVESKSRHNSGKKGEGDGNGHGNKSGSGEPWIEERREQVARMLEHVLFPAFRTRLVATKDLLGGVVEVADLKGLYRVFERC